MTQSHDHGIMTSAGEPAGRHDARQRLRILYVLPYYPFSLRSGSSFRAYNIIKRLADRHEIHVLCLGLDHRTDPDARAAEKACASITVVPHTYSRMAGVLRAIFALSPYDLAIHSNPSFALQVAAQVQNLQPDVVYYSRLPGAQYIHRSAGSTSIADQHDLAEAYWRLASRGARNPLLRAFALFNGPIAARHEREIYGRFDGVISVSPDELERTKQVLPHSIATLLLQNGADTDFFTPQHAEVTGNNIVLIGAMNAQRNVDAAIVFARNIFPEVLKRCPHAVFQIVGHSPSQSILELTRIPGIEVTGEVADVRPFLAGAATVIAPFYSGSGVKHKVPIAMSMAKACVLTSNAAQGLPLVHDQNCLIADDHGLFADHVCRLLADSDLRTRLGIAARDLILAECSWNGLVERLDGWIARVHAGRNPAA